MMLVQEYLQSHSLDDLIREHGIYPGFGNKGQRQKFCLNYDQIESRNSDPLTIECRGLILAKRDGSPVSNSDVLGETIILCRPMDRFFNQGQGEAAVIDFSDPATVLMDKLDGTLTNLYFDPFLKEWCVSTRSVPDADTSIDGFEEFTFRRLFEIALCQEAANRGFVKSRAEGMSTHMEFVAFTNHLSKSFTYCFELTAPENQVVVRYEKPGLTCLAIRNTQEGWETKQFKELFGEFVGEIVPFIKEHHFSCLDEVVEFICSKNPSEFEGMVARDKNYKRVKMKHPGYLALSSLKGSATSSPRRLMELVLLEKGDDVMPLLPAHAQKALAELQESLLTFVKTYDELFIKLRSKCESRKDFALAVQEGKHWIGPLMNMFLGKGSMKDYILSQKNQDSSSWSDSFLDRLAEEMKKWNQ